jgi:hypothetical protein
MEDLPNGKQLKADVPLAEMFGYANDLRSATQGRASYSMEFSKVPTLTWGLVLSNFSFDMVLLLAALYYLFNFSMTSSATFFGAAVYFENSI